MIKKSHDTLFSVKRVDKMAGLGLTVLIYNVCLILKFVLLEEIHSVGTINNVETSYFTQLKMCYLMTTFRCPSDMLIT